MTDNREPYAIADRFRGFLPVVVDVETGGFNAERDALLEIAACIVEMGDDGNLRPGTIIATHVQPFPGSNVDPKALEITGIDLNHPLRQAMHEKQALQLLCSAIRPALRKTGCQRAILVGHNPAFDLGFLNAVMRRTKFKHNPFHPFSTFDTATLGGLAFGQTVLARAAQSAGLSWESGDAHSAVYDVRKTTDLFCTVVNLWHAQIGIPGPLMFNN